MNFYKDPLLEKLRLIESRILGEALSDDEFADLQKLRAELADDPEASKLHAEVDAVVKARAAELEKPADTPTDNKPTVAWPTTPDEIKAFQTANPPLVADGKIGQKTMAALVAAGATPPPGFKPVGNKVTTRPPGKATQPSTGNPNLDVLNKIPNPTMGQEYWINGERFEYRIASAPGTPGAVNNGWYKNFEKGDWIGTTTNKMASKFNYSGAPEGIDAFLAKKGATSESIDRIKHLSGL